MEGQPHSFTSALSGDTIVECFRDQCLKTPSFNALSFGCLSLTYKELDEKTDELARRISARQGAEHECFIGLYIDRSMEFIVGLLSVLKAGHIFVPLDPALPQSRLHSMVQKAGLSLTLTKKTLKDLAQTKIPELDFICVEGEFEKTMPSEGMPLIAPRAVQNGYAYCMFTSGTSGSPKGVLITQSGVLNLVRDWVDRVGDKLWRRSAWWTGVGFDVSIFEIFTALLSGATLFIVPERVRYAANTYVQWIKDNNISSAYMPPFLVKELDSSDSMDLPLTSLLVGVEPLSESKLYEIIKSNNRLTVLNGYGPTEATVYTTVYSSVQNLVRPAPIGKPIKNTEIYILDETQSPVPHGVRGEIYIAGAGLAVGYVNDIELTSRYFVHNPFSDVYNTMYRTGDIGVVLPCGNIAFLGRNDLQVKINGVRVELSEIEFAINSSTLVISSAAIVYYDGGQAKVAAFVMPELTVLQYGEVKAHLANLISRDLIPSRFKSMDRLPLTVNGKIDRGALMGAIENAV